MLLINCGAFLILTWSENCPIINQAKRDANPNADPAVAGINNPASGKFEIKDTKLYVPVVPLSIESDNKLSEQLKTGFKRTIKWNKYKPHMFNQSKHINLNYLIDST